MISNGDEDKNSKDDNKGLGERGQRQRMAMTYKGGENKGESSRCQGRRTTTAATMMTTRSWRWTTTMMTTNHYKDAVEEKEGNDHEKDNE